MDRIEESVNAWPPNGLPATLADRTRRVYDRMAAVYPVSTMLFHSRAHRCALEASGIADGMRVLEVATGSGEMFRRLVKANAGGSTIGVDLSPNMAARTQRAARRKFPQARTHCQAVDARHMPFRGEAFDAVFCCYMLELLSTEDIGRALREFRRVLAPGGILVLGTPDYGRLAWRITERVYGALVPGGYADEHITRYTRRSLAAELAAAGFEILEYRYVGAGELILRCRSGAGGNQAPDSGG